jgi:MFS family permease
MAAFVAWERWYAEGAIMPLHLFKVPTFSAVVLVVLLSYMGFGISLWYSISWQQLLRHTSVLQTGINFIPFGLGSVASVGIAAWMLPRIAAQWILALGVATVIVSNLLLATMPIMQIYWSQAFAAMFISSFCPDFVFVAAQLIASNSVGRRHQGVASSLIGTLNLYGNSLGIGVGGTIETQVSHGEKPTDLVVGFRAALYFGAALAVAALALDFAFVRMPKDEREGWEDAEDQEAVVVHASASAVERQL